MDAYKRNQFLGRIKQRISAHYSLYQLLLLMMSIVGGGCHTDKSSDEPQSAQPKPTVYVTHVRIGTLHRDLELNATSSFQKQNAVKSPISGYITAAYVQPGQYVSAGQELFVLETKEARALGGSLDSLSRSLNIRGKSSIKASVSGYLAQVAHQQGDFVPEGEPLVTINDRNSLVFTLDLPFEWNALVHSQEKVLVVLPDGRQAEGLITDILPQVDPVAQTRHVLIRLSTLQDIPEGLIVAIRLVQSVKNNVQILPKSAVLTDETESSYWLMKMIDSTTAVKIPVQTGIQTQDSIEIISPVFSNADHILISGNYGVPDTLQVQIAK